MQLSTIILTGIGLFAALAYLPLPDEPRRWFRTLIKTVPLLTFTAVSALTGGPPLLTLGLLLSAAGDFALSRPGRAAFLFGLVSFALAHILYAMLFTGFADQPLWVAFSAATIPAIAMLAIGASTEIWLAPFTGSLRWPVRVYIVLIGAMMLSALTLPSAFRLVTVGAALFVLSDLILSVRMFRLNDTGPRAAPAGWGVWVFYIAGQALILWGVLFSPVLRP